MFRQRLEGMLHNENSFITLTYAPEFLPPNSSLNPYDLQLFLKRVRERIKPLRFRYYAVGEYGEQTLRPHYHLNLFGLSGYSLIGDKENPGKRAARFEDVIRSSWGLGITQTAEFTGATANYCTEYVTKSLSKTPEAWKAENKYPEFARMSLKPGLGIGAIASIAEMLKRNNYVWEAAHTEHDIPHKVRIGGREILLDRYMRNALLEHFGFTADVINQINGRKAYEHSLEMCNLLETAFAASEAQTYSQVYQKEVSQRIVQTEARLKRNAQKRKL